VLRVSYGLATLEARRWSSLSEVRAEAGLEVVVANPDGVGLGPVYEFSQSSDGLPATRAVYVQMDSEWEVPTVLGVEWAGGKWIGCNSAVYVLAPDLTLAESIDLGESFANFVVHGAEPTLFVISETGIRAFSRDGSQRWKVNVDVITDLQWYDDIVVLHQMDGPQVTVNLANGEPKPEK
jgi:hypothetical protein